MSASPTSFYIVRHNDLASSDSTPYRLNVQTSLGKITIPQLGGSLSLNGRDSKIHVVDYDIGGVNLIYSTFEVMTWKQSGSKSVLVLYGGESEIHEFALPAFLGPPLNIEGGSVTLNKTNSSVVVQWQVDRQRRVLRFGDGLEVHLLWRNDAYNYWVLNLPARQPLGLHVSPSLTNNSVIVKAGYLVRGANIMGDALYLTGDVNKTTEVEVISTPTQISSLFFNGGRLNTRTNSSRLTGAVSYSVPEIALPDLQTLSWRYVDSLPEVNSDYDDSHWTLCENMASNNPRNLSTPTSLYASDYGYHAGSLLYRGHFVSTGTESAIYLLVEGGSAFGYSVWLNSTYLGSWTGDPAAMFYNQSLPFTQRLQSGQPYVLTVLIDHMGLDEDFPANAEILKDPRGLLDYDLKGRNKSAVSWKITGNFGGEQYADLSRGPLNEGAVYAERQGYHLPGAPVSPWEERSPFEEISQASVGFFATSFDLYMPVGYDVPLSIAFSNSSVEGAPVSFRAAIYVNGWQFGKYGMFKEPELRWPVKLMHGSEQHRPTVALPCARRHSQLQRDELPGFDLMDAGKPIDEAGGTKT